MPGLALCPWFDNGRTELSGLTGPARTVSMLPVLSRRTAGSGTATPAVEAEDGAQEEGGANGGGGKKKGKGKQKQTLFKLGSFPT